jgi:hypothetical protein
MNAQISFFVALFVTAVTTTVPFFIRCTENSVVIGCTQPTCANYNPEASVDDGSCIDCDEPPTGQCTIRSDFQVEFIDSECAIRLTNLSAALCEIEVSTDSGVSWEALEASRPILLSGTGACDVMVRTADNPDIVLPYLGSTVCQCTPPVNDEAISRVVLDPERNYLSSNECRCADYVFVFPDGTKVKAIEATLYLKLKKLDGTNYEVAEIDHNTREVRVVKRVVT